MKNALEYFREWIGDPPGSEICADENETRAYVSGFATGQRAAWNEAVRALEDVGHTNAAGVLRRSLLARLDLEEQL